MSAVWLVASFIPPHSLLMLLFTFSQCFLLSRLSFIIFHYFQTYLLSTRTGLYIFTLLYQHLLQSQVNLILRRDENLAAA